MSPTVKKRITFTTLQENYEWLRKLSLQTGIPTSLFLDSLVTATRATIKDGVSEQEAMSIAFDQIAKGLRAKR